MTSAKSPPTPAQLILRRWADRGADQSSTTPASKAVTRQLAGGAPELPLMIWRKAESRNEPRSLTGRSPLLQSTPESAAPMIARRGENGGSAFKTGPTISETTLTAPSPTQSPGLNLAQLAERVSRILARQLAAERERRGMKR